MSKPKEEKPKEKSPETETKEAPSVEAKRETVPVPETAPTEPPPPDPPANQESSWTEPVKASDIPTEAPSGSVAGSESPAPTPPTVNGVSHEDPKAHLLGHRICVLSLPKGRAPVNEEVARCTAPFAPIVARAVASAMRATGAKVDYPVSVIALDMGKTGEASIVHNERVV